jgi:hypothetical protein
VLKHALIYWGISNYGVGERWCIQSIPVINLTFRGPCIVSIFLLIHFQRDATIHNLYISGKLLYVFRVVSPPIIRSTQLYLQ